MKQGEIWLVKFPEDTEGHEYKKERPAVIVESNLQLNKSNVFTILAITSNINNCLDEDILISPDNYNNLFVDSIIKVHHIQTFNKTRFIKRIGKVKDNALSDIKNYLKIHFGLS